MTQGGQIKLLQRIQDRNTSSVLRTLRRRIGQEPSPEFEIFLDGQAGFDGVLVPDLMALLGERCIFWAAGQL